LERWRRRREEVCPQRPGGSKRSQRCSAAVLPQDIGPYGWARVTRPRQRVRAQGRAVPSGGAAASRTPCQARGPTGMSALDERSLAGPRAAFVGAVRAAPGKPGARPRSGSAVSALGRDVVGDAPGVEYSASPGRCWGRLPGASGSAGALGDGSGSGDRRSGLDCNAGAAHAGGSGGCRSRPGASDVSTRRRAAS
jgi:hypothetical protein